MAYVSAHGNWGMEEVIVFDGSTLTPAQLETLDELPDNDKFHYVKAIMESEVE
jgi:hypothetical protein